MITMQINDTVTHINSGKIFVIASIGQYIDIFGQDKGTYVHLYPKGGEPNGKNSMTIPVANVRKFFKPNTNTGE